MQPLDQPSVNQMLLNDLLDIARMNVAVPDCLRIDNHDRPVFTLIQTSGLVGADLVFEPGVLDGILEGGLELLASSGKTARTGRGAIPLVGADKKMVFEKRHLCSILSNKEGCTGGTLKQCPRWPGF